MIANASNRNLSVNIVADGACVTRSSPNPSAHTDSAAITVCSTGSKTPNSHYNFDGLIFTEFPFTL